MSICVTGSNQQNLFVYIDKYKCAIFALRNAKLYYVYLIIHKPCIFQSIVHFPILYSLDLQVHMYAVCSVQPVNVHIEAASRSKHYTKDDHDDAVFVSFSLCLSLHLFSSVLMEYYCHEYIL